MMGRLDPVTDSDPNDTLNFVLNDMFTAIERFRRSGASEDTCRALRHVVLLEICFRGDTMMSTLKEDRVTRAAVPSKPAQEHKTIRTVRESRENQS